MRRKTGVQKKARLTNIEQLGDPKATTAAVELHESLYFLQHVSTVANLQR